MPVDKAEKVLADLQAKRARLIARGTEIGDERSNIAYQAHASGDAKAERRLAELHREAAEHASALAGLDAAIETAADKLAKAQQVEAGRADKAAAQELLKELDRFRAIGRELDAALSAIALHGNALWQSHTRIQQLGVNFPSGQQLEAIGGRALMAACSQTPWRRRFEPVPPRERHNIAEAVEGWASAIEKGVSARLGEQDAADAV